MITRDSATVEVIAFVKSLPLPADTQVEVIGTWVWVTFAQKPPRALIDQLKGEKEAWTGFRWIQKREAWAHACGNPTFGTSQTHPRNTYGSILVKTEEGI